ncbi:MAG: hypothetical protein HYR76_06955 [Ignavibacteria bacterium]|nr:hypothetical protein [Ignavibacteria bacterium]MBI3766072.1 hypothetical protein [Ignavibacteriales bacterium]
MIAAYTIWSILRRHVPRRQWVSSEDIFTIVESHGNLDGEDRQPQSPESKTPKWKISVRNVLVNRMKKGKVRWRKRLDDRDDSVG